MNKIKKSYFVILFIIIFVVSTMYFSFAFFTSRNEEHGKLNIVAGTLDYKIESSELVNNKVTVGYNETKVIDIKLTSLNEIDSKYEIYYNSLTSLTATEIGRVNIGYTIINKNSVTGTIGANQSKDIRIYVNNSNDKDIEIEFNVIGGLINDSLVLNNGNHITNNDVTAPDYDIKTEIIDGKTYVVVDTNDNQSGVKQVEYNGQIQTFPKNRDDYKIYLLYNSFYSEDYAKQGLYRYKIVTSVTESGTVDEIISNNYNLIINLNTYWAVSTDILTNAFDNGINIYSHGNDTSILPFVSSYKYSSNTTDSSSNGLSNVVITKDNIFTRFAQFGLHTSDPGQFFVKFNEDTEVWYQGTFEDNVYDALGYYRNNNTGWIHNQNLIGLGSDKFGKIADYLLKINTAEYEITESGDYTFKITDYVGNVVEKTVHIDV